MEDESIAVCLHIYDLTRGMAQLMSAAILGRCSFFHLFCKTSFLNLFHLCFKGKQIDGIWHTGVVVYGREYFFGGQGITSCLPVSYLFLFRLFSVCCTLNYTYQEFHIKFIRTPCVRKTFQNIKLPCINFRDNQKFS